MSALYISTCSILFLFSIFLIIYYQKKKTPEKRPLITIADHLWSFEVFIQKEVDKILDWVEHLDHQDHQKDEASDEITNQEDPENNHITNQEELKISSTDEAESDIIAIDHENQQDHNECQEKAQSKSNHQPKKCIYLRRIFALINIVILLLAEYVFFTSSPDGIFRYVFMSGFAFFEIFFSIIPLLLTFSFWKSKSRNKYHTMYKYQETFSDLGEKLLYQMIQFMITPVLILFFKLESSYSKTCQKNEYLQYTSFTFNYQVDHIMINIPKDEFICRKCLGEYDLYNYLQETVNYFKDWESNIQVKPDSTHYNIKIQGMLDSPTEHQQFYSKNASELFDYIRHQDLENVSFYYTPRCGDMCLLMDNNLVTEPNLYYDFDIKRTSLILIVFSFVLAFFFQ